jgi:hypothetical protein
MPLRILTLLILSACLAAPAPAQSIGRIAGTVTDNTGSAVVDAVVEVVSLETGETRRVVTNTSGTYAVSPLPIGSYRVQIRKDGFKGVTRNDVRMDVNSAATVDAQLEVGAMTESVTVQEQAAVIETETAAVGSRNFQN